MSNAVVLLSGGMDSAVLLAWATRRYETVYGLSFDYGSKHAVKELDKAAELARTYGAQHHVVKLPMLNEMFSSTLLQSGEDIPEGPYASGNLTSTVVPFRNGIMLSIAIGLAEDREISDVLLASHAGDHPIYPDCTEEFVTAMSAAATAGTYARVRVHSPFGTWTKRDIAEEGRRLGVDFAGTWSCYKGGDMHCGLCATCLERKEALRHDEGLDPTEYAQ